MSTSLDIIFLSVENKLRALSLILLVFIRIRFKLQSSNQNNTSIWIIIALQA